MDKAANRLLRRSEVRATSITELMLIIIFVFLMILAATRVDKASLHADNIILQAKLDEANRIIKLFQEASNEENPITALTTLRRDKQNLKVQVERQKEKIRELDKLKSDAVRENQALKTRLTVLDKIRETLKTHRLLDAHGNVDRQHLREIVENARDQNATRQFLLLAQGEKTLEAVKRLAGLAGKVRQLLGLEQNADEKDILGAATQLSRDNKNIGEILRLPKHSSAAEIVRAVREVIRKLDESKKALGEYSIRLSHAEQRGQGTPECWRKGGRTEYLLSVVISDDGYEVRGGWSSERSTDARTIPGIREIQRKIPTIKQFIRLASSIHKHGLSGGFQCLYTVRIHDATSLTNKLGWEKRRVVLMNYFHTFKFKDKLW
jgi:hypothetical protein